MATVFGSDANARTRAVLVTAKYSNLDVKVEETVPREGKFPAAYKQAFATDRIPGFVAADGFKLHETIAICSYIASKGKVELTGEGVEGKAQVLQWASWANQDFLRALGGWIHPLAFGPYNKKNVEDNKADALKCLDYLEKHLNSNTYLAGHRITIADIITASYLGRGYNTVLDKDVRAKYPNVLRFFNTVANQESYLAVAGKPEFRDTAIEYVAPKKEKAAPTPAAAAAPKEKAPKKKAAEDDDDEPAVVEPKPKHPCEALGKPTFDLDEWKRTYSNKSFEEAMAWLEEKHNPQEFSLFHAVYKYPTELTQIFMSANLIGGFHNRLEGSRKFLFGSAGVYGTANNSAIQGVYLARGSNIEDIFGVAPDRESYDIKPIDLKADNKLVREAWNWEGTMDGLEYADGKVFK